MSLYIYDIEVFSDDWIVDLASPDPGAKHITIHNDNAKLKKFLDQPDIVIGGFNNKHYDNWILKTMYNGGSNVEVKRHNDFIIGGGNAWEYPFLYGSSPIPCKTFDLKDDIADPFISLKAIEGNMKLPIVESSVSFDINRPLTELELAEVIRYCRNDVDSTIALYWARKDDYLDAKRMIGTMYNVPENEALGLTNAKLCARVLGAKKVDRDDERDYKIPENIDTKKIPKIVLDFFMQIQDETIPNEKLFGSGKGGSKGMTLDLILTTGGGSCPVSYAWGGVHGAKPCVTIEETADRVIINEDVSSLYPNSMINFGYCSRSMADPEAYKKLVERRIGYKHAGDALRSKALKLPINTAYGAMLNPYNDLADRWAGRSVCITNQLAMTVLIVNLSEACSSIDFVNINTDGIMFTIDRSEVATAEAVVSDWSAVTNFEMERDDFVKVIQKDVNNYIGIKSDGKMKTKGGFVSLYKGGNFKTNSLSIIHKSIVDYLVNNVPVETTIRKCNDIFQFQQIVKTGGSFEGSFHYVDGKREPVQKVNRVYAVKDPRYGSVVKGKWITEKRKKNKDTGKMESIKVDPPVWSETIISECPTHTGIDNENRLTVNDLDLDYYIDMAKKRVDKYIHIDPGVKRRLDKIKEEVTVMATTENKKESKLNIYQKLNLARMKFLATPIKKTGVNRYAEFTYFQLEDIVPVAEPILNEVGLAMISSITFEKATATIVNVEDPGETITFEVPAKDPSIEANTKMSAIQGMGAYNTYQRRYLYLMIFDIVEADTVDATIAKPETKATVPKKSTKPATEAERAEIKETLTAKENEATEPQKKAISAGLKKLRAKYMNDKKEIVNKDLEAELKPYIGAIVERVKTGISASDADKILIEIGNKIQA